MAFGYVTPYRRPMTRRISRGNDGSSLFDLNRQINRLFDDLFDLDDDDNDGRERRMRGGSYGVPAMDIDRTENSYEITAELPGVKQDDIDLSVEDGILALRGEKRRMRKSDDNSWSERSYGSFERRIQLPQDIDEDNVDASFSDGVLTITLPRTEEKTSARKIEVKSGSQRENDGSRLVEKGDNKTRIEENA